MNLTELREKGNDLLGRIPKDIFIALILVFASSASFGLGIMAGRGGGQGGFSISQIPLTASAVTAVSAPAAPTSIPAGGQVVASKNGTKYFLPWCGGVSQIKDENKIWFASKEEAEIKGYQPASNCKGLPAGKQGL